MRPPCRAAASGSRVQINTTLPLDTRLLATMMRESIGDMARQVEDGMVEDMSAMQQLADMLADL